MPREGVFLVMDVIQRILAESRWLEKIYMRQKKSESENEKMRKLEDRLSGTPQAGDREKGLVGAHASDAHSKVDGEKKHAHSVKSGASEFGVFAASSFPVGPGMPRTLTLGMGLRKSDRYEDTDSDAEGEADDEELEKEFEQEDLLEAQLKAGGGGDKSENGDAGSYKVPEHLVQTDPRNGLTEEEVHARTKKWGRNELPEEKTNHFLKFLGYFTGPIEILIIIAGRCIAAGLQRWIDLGVIAALLLLNASVGFIQEYQAGNVVDSLKSALALKATAIRGGVPKEIEAKSLVPGDVIAITEGDVCPADARLLGEDSFLQLDQSAITGESLAVTKRYNDMLYSSSAVKRGSGLAVIIATGPNTFVGQAAVLVSRAQGVGHFRKVLNQIAYALMFMDLIAVIAVSIAALYRGESILDMLLFIMILTVVAVPIALPAVVTTTMAVGAAMLAEKQAIVSRLTSIEALAGVDILCSDKTGTLTKNKLTVHDPYVLPGHLSDELFLAAALASHRSGRGIDPIDKAIMKTLRKYPEAKRALHGFRGHERR
ncbi:plasma membrane H+-ATPase [Gonapodya sp. JEL0774]|nr:plasma membrane H+-ATPase [Gonapodya sp. JEL0774]